MEVSDPSKLLLASQIEHVKLVQKRLEHALEGLKSEDDKWLKQRAIELEEECRGKVLLLQVTGRIHEKIRNCRETLLSAAKAGKNVQKLQERFFQLECDLDHILSRSRKYTSLLEGSPTSKFNIDEETAIGDETKGKSKILQHLSWRIPDGPAYKEEERGSLLEPCQVLGAQIPGAEKRVSECELQDHRLSSHQKPKLVFPADPSVWRRTSLDSLVIQPRIVIQPVLPDEHPGSFRRIKQKKSIEKKYRLDQYFPLFHWASTPDSQQSKIVDAQIDPQKWQRLKDLSECLILAPREQEQMYAAKALGCLGCRNDFVISALCHTLQVSKILTVRYETVKALTMLGCLRAEVVKEMVTYLMEGSKELILDILIALKTTLQKWFHDAGTRATTVRLLSDKGDSLEDKQSLTGALIQLLSKREHLDDISLEAAICLAHLAPKDGIALSTLRSYLSHRNMKKSMQALRILVMCMRVHDSRAIQAILEQIAHSKVFKHRIETSYLLITIGLQRIRQEDMEGKVFDMLKKKLYDDPVLAVRQAVALTVEALQMKKLMCDIVEKQLEDQNEAARIQAVISLGVLGLRSHNILNLLMEMLDLDHSKEVRIQIIRVISILRLKDPNILRNLRLKEKGEGSLAREAAKALRNLQKITRTKRR